MEVLFFDTTSELRDWFVENHQTATELYVGFYKVGVGKPSVTWSEAVDEAICVGWIDSVRKSLDSESYTNRFTPRKPSSIWSAVNIKKVENLTAAGRMLPAGIAAFEKRKAEKSKIYSFEQESVELDEASTAIFQANEKAWTFFEKQGASYKKTAIWWILSAKQTQTKEKRLAELITDSENKRRLKHLTR